MARDDRHPSFLSHVSAARKGTAAGGPVGTVSALGLSLMRDKRFRTPVIVLLVTLVVAVGMGMMVLIGGILMPPGGQPDDRQQISDIEDTLETDELLDPLTNIQVRIAARYDIPWEILREAAALATDDGTKNPEDPEYASFDPFPRTTPEIETVNGGKGIYLGLDDMATDNIVESSLAFAKEIAERRDALSNDDLLKLYQYALDNPRQPSFGGGQPANFNVAECPTWVAPQYIDPHNKVKVAQAAWAVLFCKFSEVGYDKMPPSNGGNASLDLSSFPSLAHQIAAEGVLVAACESGLSTRYILGENAYGYGGLFQFGDYEISTYGYLPGDPFKAKTNIHNSIVATFEYAYRSRAQVPFSIWHPWAPVNTNYGGPNVKVAFPVVPRFASTRAGYEGQFNPNGYPNWAVDPFSTGFPSSGVICSMTSAALVQPYAAGTPISGGTSFAIPGLIDPALGGLTPSLGPGGIVVAPDGPPTTEAGEPSAEATTTTTAPATTTTAAPTTTVPTTTTTTVPKELSSEVKSDPRRYVESASMVAGTERVWEYILSQTPPLVDAEAFMEAEGEEALAMYADQVVFGSPAFGAVSVVTPAEILASFGFTPEGAQELISASTTCADLELSYLTAYVMWSGAEALTAAADICSGVAIAALNDIDRAAINRTAEQVEKALASAGAGDVTQIENGGPVPEEATVPLVLANGCDSMRVHAAIAPIVTRMLDHAYADGISLCGWGWRDTKRQEELRVTNKCADVFFAPASSCSPPTARPGSSQHERGLALDLTYNGSTIKSRYSVAFKWLQANAAAYGYQNLPSEPWHWSTNGR